MASSLQPIRGLARVVSSSSAIYDESVTFASDQSAATTLTLPAAGTYTDKDLKVFLNGKFWEEGEDYSYVGSGTRTQIQITEAAKQNDIIRYIVEGNSVLIYDEVFLIGAGGLLAGNNITLPLAKTYADTELRVFLMGQLMEVLEDYNYVGGIPRTQIQTVFDLEENERVRFRIES